MFIYRGILISNFTHTITTTTSYTSPSNTTSPLHHPFQHHHHLQHCGSTAEAPFIHMLPQSMAFVLRANHTRIANALSSAMRHLDSQPRGVQLKEVRES